MEFPSILLIYARSAKISLFKEICFKYRLKNDLTFSQPNSVSLNKHFRIKSSLSGFSFYFYLSKNLLKLPSCLQNTDELSPYNNCTAIIPIIMMSLFYNKKCKKIK